MATAAPPELHPIGQTARQGGWLSGNDLVILLFFLAFYTNFAVIAVQFHGVPQTVGSALAFFLLVPAMKFLLLDRQPPVITATLPLLLLFLSAVLLAAVLSRDPASSMGFINLYITEGLVLFLLVTNAVRSPSVLSLVIWVLILSGAFLGAVSIYQEFTGSYANSFWGFAQVDRIDDPSGGFAVGEQNRPRLGGPLGSENRYAQILIVLLPMALIRLWREESRRLRAVGGISALLILGGILLTFSRGAAVGLALILIAFWVLRELRLREVVAMVAVAAAVVVFAVPDYIARVDSLQGVTATFGDEPTDADGAIRGRQTSNLAAWYTFRDNPAVGVGPGQYFKEYSNVYANRLGLRYFEGNRRAHSLYIELAADVGIVGLTAFLAMAGVTLYQLHRLSRRWRGRREDLSIAGSCMLFALIAYLATGLFLHLSFQRYFWVVVALASAAVWILRRESEREYGMRGSSVGTAEVNRSSPAEASGQ